MFGLFCQCATLFLKLIGVTELDLVAMFAMLVLFEKLFMQMNWPAAV